MKAKPQSFPYSVYLLLSLDLNHLNLLLYWNCMMRFYMQMYYFILIKHSNFDIICWVTIFFYLESSNTSSPMISSLYLNLLFSLLSTVCTYNWPSQCSRRVTSIFYFNIILFYQWYLNNCISHKPNSDLIKYDNLSFFLITV